MTVPRRYLTVLAWLVVSLLVAGLAWRAVAEPLPPIRIGVLHALSGAQDDTEHALVDAVRLAVEQINAGGGLNNRQVEIVLADNHADAATAASEARRLIAGEGVSVIFGCGTSTCRKAVLPVVEQYQHLLVFPLRYEGMEASPNILYTGSAPNQQIVPGTRWALENLGRRVYLVGSDYVYSRMAHLMMRDIVRTGKGVVLGERVAPMGERDFDAVVAEIAQRRPDVVFNTLNGISNEALFSAMVKAGLAAVPVFSFGVDETGLRAWGGTRLSNHFGVWSYFQSLPGKTNQQFVQAFKQRFGADRVTSDPIEAAYVGVQLWANAVRDAKVAEPASVRVHLRVQSAISPSGKFAVDAETHHVWKYFRVGKVKPDGQFEQIYVSEEPLKPAPWPTHRSHAQWLRLLVSDREAM